MLIPVATSNGPAAVGIVLVHGTFARDLSWLSADSPLVRELCSLFADANIFRFPWDGCPHQSSRYEAARRLGEDLASIGAVYNRVIVVGHSHGGNVALQAIQSISGSDIQLITLATPFLWTHWSNPRDAVTNLFIPTLSVFLLSALAAIGVYTFLRQELPITACLIVAAMFVGGIFLCFRIRNSIEGYNEARRARYANLTVRYPLHLLVLYVGADEFITFLFNPIQTALKRIKGRSSRANAKEIRVSQAIEALNLMPFASLLLLVGAVMALTGVDALYVMVVFILMCCVVVFNLAPTATLALWSAISGTIASIYWPVYSAFQSGNIVDSFFVVVRAADRPRIQTGCDTNITAKAIPLASEAFFDRLARRAFFHTAICKNHHTMAEINYWLANIRTSG